MTLFDAISLTPSGDSQDFTYEGLVIERNDAGHIDRMYVKKGYGGEKTEFLPERDDEGRLYTAPWPAGVDRYGRRFTQKEMSGIPLPSCVRIRISCTTT